VAQPTLVHLPALLGRVGRVQGLQDGQEPVTVAPLVLAEASEPLGGVVVADRLGLAWKSRYMTSAS
jgi:hypothetical protein